MNEKLAKIKQKIKDNAPAVIITTISTVAAAALLYQNQTLKKTVRETDEELLDLHRIKYSWRLMDDTGESQIFCDQDGRPVFEMSPFYED